MRWRSIRWSCASLLLLALSLWAADAWQTKPYTEWSDKDLAKVVGSSPWVRDVRVTPSRAPLSPVGNSRQRQRSGAADGSAPISADVGMRGAPDISDPASGLDRQAGHDTLGDMTQTVTVVVRWQSALPMRQAEMRARYGLEVGASQQAKEFLAQEESEYVIGVFGVPAAQIGEEQTKRDALALTTLSVKGKPAIRPTRVDLNMGATTATGRLMDLYFVFPKTTPFSIADKDVDLTSTIESLTVRCVFHLKDMIFGGNLAL